jgi:putative photosynthetic complex assembly protein 2
MTYLFAIGFALFLWWFSTGVLLYLNHLPRSTYRWSMAIASLAMVGCLIGVRSSATDATEQGALIAFTQALLIWAWVEMSYFMGLITGPRKSDCPGNVNGWSRFILAVQTSLYHELLVIGLGLTIIVLSWDMPNQVAAGTFVTLWVMRWSAKLNLFLGVRNVNSDWFPAHLQFLTTYMRQRKINLFFPISVVAGTLVFAWLLASALATPDAFSRTGYLLVTTLLGLALLEHWFLVLPINDSALWQWALRSAKRASRRPTKGKRKAEHRATMVNGRRSSSHV